MTQHSKSTGYIFLLSIGLIWGSQFYFNSLALDAIPALTVAAARALIGAITLSIVSFFYTEPRIPAASPWRNRLLYVVIALFEVVLPLFLMNWGQQRIESSITAVLLGTVPLMTVLLTVFFTRTKRLTFSSSFSVLLGFAGIVVLVLPDLQSGWSNNVLGALAVLLASFSFSISLILLAYTPHHAPVRAVRNILWLAALPLVILSLWQDAPWSLAWNVVNVSALLELGMLCSGAVYLMYAVLTHRSGPVFTSLSGYLVPLFGVLIGIVWMGERLTIHSSFAMVLVFFALCSNELTSVLAWLRVRQAGRC